MVRQDGFKTRLKEGGPTVERQGDETTYGEDSRDGRAISPEPKKGTPDSRGTRKRTPGGEKPGTVQATEASSTKMAQ
eukprot:8706009-Prorocentrum_lima.AAC.1